MIKAIPIALSILGALTGVRAVSETERVSELLTRGAEIEAVQVHPSIWLASGNSNAYLVETKDGVVVIDTGIVSQAGMQSEMNSLKERDHTYGARMKRSAQPNHRQTKDRREK